MNLIFRETLKLLGWLSYWVERLWACWSNKRWIDRQTFQEIQRGN